MNFPTNYIIIIAILSIILIASYPVLLAGNAEYLWGPIKGNLRKLYYISIFLVLVGFIPFSYLLLTCNRWNQSEINKIFYSLLTLIIASWLWIIFAIFYATKRFDKNMLRMIIVLILLIVSLSILYLLYIVYKHYNLNLVLNKNCLMKYMVYIGLGYAFLHTFFMDFILWTYLVLLKNN